MPLPDQSVELTRPEISRIYVARESQMRGLLRDVRVYENEQEVGIVGPESYLCWERPAGRSLLRIVFDGRPLEGDSEGLVDLERAPGEIHYYAVRLERISPRTDIDSKAGTPRPHRMTAESGRVLIASREAPTTR